MKPIKPFVRLLLYSLLHLVELYWRLTDKKAYTDYQFRQLARKRLKFHCDFYKLTHV